MLGARWTDASPFEVVLLGVSVASGCFVLAGADVPLSLAVTLPPWAQLAWSLGLALGGVVSLIGLSLPDPIDARLSELSGLALVAGTVATYAVALILVQGEPAAVIAALAGAYAVACSWRCWQLWRAVRTVVHNVRER